MKIIVGRVDEQRILNQKLASREPELIALYGRRRVGKTHLIRTFFKDSLVFQMTGIHKASLADQLKNFSLALGAAIKSPAPLADPDNWLQAFSNLDKYLLDRMDPTQPAVLFFDEFPWIHTPRSNFLRAFDHWWNSSCTQRSNVKVVICGSAASWMIERIFNDRGGLHNRVTQRIRLLPFDLKETGDFLKSLGSVLDHYQVLQLYMVMGGIPFYLQHIVAGESAAQAIDRLCFSDNGLLRTEYKNLYESLFTNPGKHEKIIRALSKNSKGLTRREIMDECDLTTGGTASKLLKELEESGFLAPYSPFGKAVNESVYKLTDEYSRFYQKFIENRKASGPGSWLRQVTTQSYISWSGFSFESVCHKHVRQIKKSLGIEGVLTEESGWRHRREKESDQPGTQIDLLLDRQDRCINVCEIKFSGDKFLIDRKYSRELDGKLSVFRRETRTRKTLFLTMITTYGVEKNEYYPGRVLAEVTMEDLFS